MWKDISTAPTGEDDRVLIYDPSSIGREIMEARLYDDGTYYDPTYWEWFSSTKATHWMPLPNPPLKDENND